MKRKLAHITLLLVAMLLLIASCSTEKDAALNKGYHNMTARFNGYYNANVIIDETLESYRMSFHDDYTKKTVPLIVYPTKEDATSLNPQLDEAIAKCEKVILRHSMPNPARTKNKSEEHCRWIDDNWLVIAQVHYMKQEYELAEQKLKYVAATYPWEESVHEARIWLAKTYIAKGNYPEAKRILAEVQVSVDDYLGWKNMNVFERLKEKKKGKKQRQKNKKNGVKEPAMFPKRLMEDFEITQAELYIAQENYTKAIEHLEMGIHYCKDRKRKARYMFVLAQLYGLTGDGDRASFYYNKVAHSNAPFEMQFKAKIYKALSATGGGEELRKELRKMLKDGKNQDYKDQIYYALAELDMREGNVEDAKKNYSASAFFSVDNNRQKGLSYLRLADIHFGEKDYLNAQKYYDSCVKVMPEEYEDYKAISRKAEGLADLVFHYETYVFEDSVQRIALMPEKERNRFLEKTLKDIKEEEARKKAEQEQRLLDQQNRINNTTANSQDGSKWYFYNMKVKGSGFNDFRALWGQRTLEDNWRRSNKTSLSGIEEGNESDSSETVKTDSLTVDILLADIPLTPEAMDSSNNRLMNSLYMLGIIYKEQLFEDQEAIKYFTAVVDRGIEHPKVLPAMYQLYLLYKKQGSSKADGYKSIILNDHPDSEIAMLIQDPDYLKKQEEKKQAELKEYGKIYEDYRYQRYNQVIASCSEIIINHPENKYINKYYLLKAFAISYLTPGNTTAIAEPLRALVALDPSSEEGIQAKIYLAMLDRGESIVPNNNNSNQQDNRFEKDLTVEHFFIVVFPNDKGDINPVKIRIANFNKEYFRQKGFKITNSVLGPDHQIIIVKTFSNYDDCLPYLNTYKKPQSQMILGTTASDYQYFVISKKNFGELSITKNIPAYLEFYRNSYPAQ